MRLLFSISLIFILSSCGRQGSPQDLDPKLRLMGKTWRIVSLPGMQGADLSRRQPYLVFRADGSYTGSTGCNRLRGNFGLNGDSIRISSPISTKMACPGWDEVELGVLLLVEKAAVWELQNDTVRLYSGNTVQGVLVE